MYDCSGGENKENHKKYYEVEFKPYRSSQANTQKYASGVSNSLWPQGCSPTGSSVQGTFKARILEQVAIFYSRESSWPRNQTRVFMSPALEGEFFTPITTWEALKP